MSGLMYPGGSGKTRFVVCHMAGNNDLRPSAICFKLYRNKIDSARLIDLTYSTQSAFGVFTFPSTNGSNNFITIQNSIKLKVIGSLSILQGQSASSVGPSVGAVLNAGSSQTYYNPGGQSGRTVGLIIYEEIQ